MQQQGKLPRTGGALRTCEPQDHALLPQQLLLGLPGHHTVVELDVGGLPVVNWCKMR